MDSCYLNKKNISVTLQKYGCSVRCMQTKMPKKFHTIAMILVHLFQSSDKTSDEGKRYEYRLYSSANPEHILQPS